MEKADDEFYSQVQIVLDLLADGEFDDAIKRWEAVFNELASHVSSIAVVSAMASYAQGLHRMHLIRRAREVDSKIENWLDIDKNGGFGKISEQAREALLQDIAERWGLETDEDIGLSPPPSPQYSESFKAPPQPDASLKQNETSVATAKPIFSAQRAQSSDLRRKHATVTDELAQPRKLPVPLDDTTIDEIPVSGNPILPTSALQTVDLTTSEGKARWWFSRLENMTHNFMYGLESRYFGFKADGERYKRVKVAILDNGIAYRKREHRNAMRKYWDCVVGYESFIDHENAMDVLNDDSGHGTAVTFQVMKTCPTAEVYICRVVQKIGDKWIVDQDAVARAIYQAADGKNWGVDIINMSFGWDYNHRVVGKAISFAKDQGVLLFASTSNYGLTTPADILYPASADEVISVDAADGLGNPAGFNPSSVAELGKDRFTAPGIGLCSPISDETFDGTSFASPIAAGVAALVLEFARQSPLENCQSVAECLRDRLGMVLVLRAMSKRKGEEKFKFLCPEMLLGDAWGTYGGDGRPGTRRYFVAYELVQILRKSYGKEVGQEVFPTVEERKDVAESGVA